MKTIKGITDILSMFLPFWVCHCFPLSIHGCRFLGTDKEYDYLRKMVIWLSINERALE